MVKLMYLVKPLDSIGHFSGSLPSTMHQCVPATSQQVHALPRSMPALFCRLVTLYWSSLPFL